MNQSRSNKLKFLKSTKFWLLGLGVLILLGIIWFFSTPHSAAIKYAFPSITGATEKEPDRINVLLLGIAGGRHDGATLTDSIIVASYHTITHKVVLVSIPRDLWVDDVAGKVNTIYQDGLKDDKGLAFAKEEIGKITGVPIDYAVRLDFSGFAKAIDLIGGIAVDVPRTFDDYNYPIEGKETDLCGNTEQEIDLTPEQAVVLKTEPGKKKVILTPEGKPATESADFACRYDHIHFDKGLTQMNGSIALTFVRSRMGTNSEGSDFARSRRQQLVIEAFRNKVLSLGTLGNPQKVAGLIKTLGETLETDIPLDKYLKLYSAAKDIKSVESIVLGDLGGGKTILETAPPGQYGGYVLVPPNNSFDAVRELIKQKLDDQASSSPRPSVTPTASPK